MTITGGSALPKDDIARMMREAEQFAEEDRGRKEEVETRNSAESLVYSTEKFLAENGDKVPAETKGEVESAVGDLKRALEGGDVTAIQTAHDALSRTSQKLGEAMYAQAQAAGGTGAPGGFGEGATASSDDEVVDAEIVDEPKREGGSA